MGCSEFCSPEARDDPTLWGVDDDGNECFLWNNSIEESSNSWIHGMSVPRIAYFLSLDKAVASVVNAAKWTLDDTDEDTGPERSAKGCLSTFA